MRILFACGKCRLNLDYSVTKKSGVMCDRYYRVVFLCTFRFVINNTRVAVWFSAPLPSVQWHEVLQSLIARRSSTRFNRSLIGQLSSVKVISSSYSRRLSQTAARYDSSHSADRMSTYFRQRYDHRRRYII